MHGSGMHGRLLGRVCHGEGYSRARRQFHGFPSVRAGLELRRSGDRQDRFGVGARAGGGGG